MLVATQRKVKTWFRLTTELQFISDFRKRVLYSEGIQCSRRFYMARTLLREPYDDNDDDDDVRIFKISNVCSQYTVPRCI